MSASTEDEKEKASLRGWKLKEGSESTLGYEGSAQTRCEQIWWGNEGSGRPREPAPQRGMGEFRGHGGDAQGVQDKQGGQESRAK